MPNKPFEYTLNMASIFQGKLSELKSYYCREDIALALSDYDHAPKDAKSFRMRDLSRLCTARGLDAQAFKLFRAEQGVAFQGRAHRRAISAGSPS